MSATAILYIDGFNLYRRSLASHPDVKWLDVATLARNLLQNHRVVKVHYFTAKLRPLTPKDQGHMLRQQVYLRALATLAPDVEVHFGKFRIDRRDMAASPVTLDPTTGKPRTVPVKKIEEKGSDVNLAVQMMLDAHRGRADLYAMLTNDSDQVQTLRTLKEEMGCNTGLVLPVQIRHGSKELLGAAPDVVLAVDRPVLVASQFPDTLTDADGTITRPKEWK